MNTNTLIVIIAWRYPPVWVQPSSAAAAPPFFSGGSQQTVNNIEQIESQTYNVTSGVLLILLLLGRQK